MSTQIATNDQHMREFQKKVIDKLKADIGAMLPDAALAGLVEKAVDEQFFTKRTTGLDYSGRPTGEKPSWFVEEVAKMAETQIKEYVAAWLEQNKETIQKAVKEFLEAQNLTLLTVAAMRMVVQQDMFEFTQNLARQIKQGY